MSLNRKIWLALAALVLTAALVWPLPALGLPAFSAHMIAHMALVAIAAPLCALGLSGGRFDPALTAPRLVSAIPASLGELGVVWAWHTPALHQAARAGGVAFVVEQASFAVAGLWLWCAALGGGVELRRRRALSGIVGLLSTSMHMTLLGALIALSQRVLFAHPQVGSSISPLLDQQLGGAIMLLVGGAAYLAGGLWLVSDALLAPKREVGAA